MIGAAGRSSQTNDGHDMVHYAETYTGSRRHAYSASRQDHAYLLAFRIEA